MELEIHYFEVTHVAFGKKTIYSEGVLHICKEELKNLICKERAIEDVDVRLAEPGESVRITNILDIAEPRIKEKIGSYYPGFLNKIFRAGDGVTKILKNVAILEIARMPGFIGGLVDMRGRLAPLTPYSKTHNVCILLKPDAGVDQFEFALASKRALLRTSVYLANATKGQRPTKTKVFKLGDSKSRKKELPRCGYLLQLHSHGPLREPFIYGGNTRHYYPTILHPNEILDGAIVCGHYNISPAFKNSTYAMLNNPVILQLFKRHGVDLNFKGVVIAPEPASPTEVERTAMMSTSLLKYCLSVQGVVITKEGGGHTDVALMRNCEECEKLGIKTVLIDNEWLGSNGKGEIPFLYVSQTANAIISVGNADEVIEVPPMDRIIGDPTMSDINGSLWESVTVPIRCIPDAISQVGLSYITTKVL